MSLTIALDAMGGDHGPCVVVPAALEVLGESPSVSLTLVGDRESIISELRANAEHPRLNVHHATQRVEMTDLPSQALRTKKDSSMRVAIDRVKAGDADAAVSAGNTGALMATARFVLKTLPGIDRPAIISALPASVGHTHVLDLGATVESSPEQLFQFAVMGSVLAQAIDGLADPRVGLLNIGEEEIKGNERVKEAGRLLSGSSLNYIGFVEGTDIYNGTADVVVCDGFAGNVALKSSEGVAQLIAGLIREEFGRNWLTKAAGALARPVLRAVGGRIDPRTYNGATLIGLRGIVIKSHGSADKMSFANAIRQAIKEIENDVPNRINHQLDAMLARKEAV
ncbi:MAG: phosphate acyltransferase PlsX [Pseudomonadota bacterium]